MRVLFVPNFSRDNPYQALLANALSALGVETSFDSSRFTGRWFLKNRQPGDVVHLHWTHPFFVVKGDPRRSAYRAMRFLFKLVVIRAAGVRVVWTVHNLYNHEREMLLLDRIVSILLTRLCHVMQVGCERAKGEVQRYFKIRDGSKIRVISLGNYISSYPNEMNRGEARQRLGIDTEECVFLHFGVIRPYKGVPELIEVFGELGLPSTKLLVTGKPFTEELENDLRARCRGNEDIILALGRVPEEEIQVYMNAADAVVLPFQEMLTSSSALLAMSFGRPVVAPAIGCLPEMVTEEAGILYDPDEPEALKTALRRCVVADLETIGRRAYERALKLRWDEISARVIRLYDDAR